MVDNYKGYPNFNEDQIVSRQTFNRLVTCKNISEDLGKTEAARYLDQFPEWVKVAVAAMSVAINKEGFDKIKRQIFRNQNEYGELING